MRKFDVVVIGGGIAGLATAEMFARNGYAVLLVEKGDKVFSAASSDHHEWFHFGSLYSAGRSFQFLKIMLKGVEDLLTYYSGFQGMNFWVAEDGRLKIATKPGGWFRDERLLYLLTSHKHPDFAYTPPYRPSRTLRLLATKTYWKMIVSRQFIATHGRFQRHNWKHHNATDDIPKVAWAQYKNTLVQPFWHPSVALEPDLHRGVPSLDCPMNAHHIARDLMSSLLTNNGKVLVKTAYRSYRKVNKASIVEFDNAGPIEARKLILALGDGFHKHVDAGHHLKTVASPLLVAYPAVCDINFVRLTPFAAKSLNHIRHYCDSRPYSLIGGGYSAPMGNHELMRQAEQTLIEYAVSVLPALRKTSFRHVYFGHKTEAVSKPEKRNYGYRIFPLDENVYGIVPGKFTLGFSLAVATYHQIIGCLPVKHVAYTPHPYVDQYISQARHKLLLRELELSPK